MKPEVAVHKMLAPLAAQRHELTPERQAVIWQRLVAQRAPRRRLLDRWAPLVVLAAAAALVAGVWILEGPGPDVGRPAAGLATPGAEGGPPTQERASRALPSGATLQVAGRLTVLDAGPVTTRLRLDAGRVTSHVPHLAGDQRFLVETPNAIVEVRGTVFTVEVTPGGVTRVEVTEGTVEALRSRTAYPATARRVTRGQSLALWPTTEAGATAAEAAGDFLQAIEINTIFASELGGLERQNRLLALGHVLDQRSASEAALFWHWLEPDAGPHADEVAFRHVQALRRAGQDEAAREAAQRFRQRYPHSPRAPD